MISQIIPSDAWSIPIGKSFPKENYPEISFRVPWEQLQMTRDGARQGCPIGGLGAGSIGRTYFGDFARWQIIPYEHVYDNEVYGSQFHVFVKPDNSGRPFIQTLMAGSPADSTRQSLLKILSTWPWNYPAEQGTMQHSFQRPGVTIQLILKIRYIFYSNSFPLLFLTTIFPAVCRWGIIPGTFIIL